LATDAQATFFSYSRSDSDFVLRLAEDLKAAGANVWLDQLDIKPGQRWAHAVQDALTNCPRLLVILSPSSVSSTNVDDEVAFALEEHKTVIPVLYRECKVPFRLRPYQYVDFRTDYSQGLRVLLKNLGAEHPSEQGISAPPAMPKHSQTDLQDADARKRAAEQARLDKHMAVEKKRSPDPIPSPPPSSQTASGAAPYQDGVAEAPERVVDRRALKRSFLSKFPSWVKVAIAVCGILIVASVLYRSAMKPRSWKPQSSGTSAKLFSVAFATPQSGWAVGDSGTILHTEDGGNNWKPQSSDTKEGLNSVAFVTPQLGWAVGSFATILHTEDGGDTWKPQSGGSIWSLLSVAFATPQLGWAVGELGAILHTEDGGGSWKPQSNGTTANLHSVAFATPQSGWAVSSFGTILHTEDGGGTWKPQSSGTSKMLLSVAFVTPKAGWVVGDGGTILHTEDGGGSWKPQSSGTRAFLNSVAFVTPKSGWAVGRTGVILHTEDGGASWKPQSSGTKEDLNSVAFATPQSGWAVGHGGTILHWH
jgi:photosystem II stability/assembly factor-like uncharacterized protein